MSRAERVALYDVREVRALLRMLSDRTINELIPEIHPTLGVRYPKIEEIAGEHQKAKTLLDQLVKAGILLPRFYEKSIVCPQCGSRDVTFRYHCPHCGSYEIEKRELYEHIECGTMDSDEHFIRDGKIFCPKCSKPLEKVGVDYRKAGTWFRCRNCDKRFDAPEGRHHCRECDLKFGIKESVLTDVYSYVLDKTAETEFSRESLFLAPIKEMMKEAGYQLDSSNMAPGVSGTSHLFDLVGSKTKADRRTVLTIDIIVCDKACNEEHVISVFAKTFDVAPTGSILIAIPGLSDKARKLAELYKLKVIEGEKPEEIVQRFHGILTSIT